MNEEEIRKRKQWQEEVYKKLEQVTEEKEINVLGKKFTILPGMFAPLWGDSLLLAKNVLKETKKEDYVLDLGTGTGIQGIFAAEKAAKVLSVDVNPLAVKCAKINVEKNKRSNKINVQESDLFFNVKDNFDLILFNPPFRWFKPRSMLERGELDEDYKTLRTFFEEVRSHLKKNGRILLVFSDSGDIRYLEKLIKENNFDFEIVDKETLNGWLYAVYRIHDKVNVKVRKATEKDFPRIFEIEKKSYTPQLQAKQEILIYRMKTFGIWVAEIDNKVVGFFSCVPAKLSFDDSDINKIISNRKPYYLPWFEEYKKGRDFNTLFVTSTAVESSYQKKGVGTAMVKYSLELAKDLGFSYRASALRCQYAKYHKETNKSIEEFIKEVKERKIEDKFLDLYLNLGFELDKPLPNYEPYNGSLNYNIFAYKKI